MDLDKRLIGGIDSSVAACKKRWPARLDWLQSASGLLLALFMWGHMLFVATILISRDAMWAVSRFFEGYFFFGRSYPVLVSLAAGGVIALIVFHALLALRKFPNDYRQFATFRQHMKMLRHNDTSLWFWQAVTGFSLFFLATPHLFVMLSRPDLIDPFHSGDRVWSDHFWPLYILLLVAVELHGGIGLYRLAIKWSWFVGANFDATRRRLKTLKWLLTAFVLLLGFAVLGAYIRIGIEHAPAYGQPYEPSAPFVAAGQGTKR